MNRKLALAALAAAGLFVIAGAIVAGVLIGRGLFAPAGPALVATPVLLRQVQGLNRLVTVRYVMEKVVVLEDVKWYGGNRVLLVAHGVANAGIDLAGLGPDALRVAGASATVRLPRAKLMDVYLDERNTRVIERSTGLLRDFDKDMEQDARRRALDEIRVAARDSGILRDAEDRARAQIEAVLRGAGLESVTVTIGD